MLEFDAQPQLVASWCQLRWAAQEHLFTLLEWVVSITTGGWIKFLGDFLFQSFLCVIMLWVLGATTCLIGWRCRHKNLEATNLHISHLDAIHCGYFVQLAENNHDNSIKMGRVRLDPCKFLCERRHPIKHADAIDWPLITHKMLWMRLKSPNLYSFTSGNKTTQ